MSILSKTLKAPFLFATLLLAGLASADVTIAVIDQQRVLFGSDAAQAASAQLQQDFASEEGQVRQLEQDLTRLQQRGESDAALMSDQERQDLNNEIQTKLAQREQLVRRLQAAQQERRQAFVAEHEQPLTAVLEEIIEERNIDLLISADEVLFAQADMDITEEALNRFNASLNGDN